MHDLLRARLRTVLDALSGMAGLLPTLGFGRSPEPPTGPIHREDVSTEAPQEQPELHEQQHEAPGHSTPPPLER